ncbi:MAG TPA: sterol desaturase family protein [Steroidobacteraceae bacterium]|nr:sterol desaturase family protein [Steroidobacteraceae bacterium]
MLHQLLTIFSISTLIYLGFSAAELALGRYRLRGISLNDWIVDFGCYGLHKALVPPFVAFVTAAITVKAFPHWHNLLAGTPVWAQFLAFVVAEDMVQYWYHRSVHTFPVLWPLHLAHHGAPYMGVRMASRNSVAYSALFPNHFTAGFLVYLGFGETYVWYSTFKNVVTTAAHSELRWDAFLYRYRVLAPLAWIVQRTISTPTTHFAHHALHEGDGIGHYSGNFGNLLFFWDVLFGTALISRKYPPAFGIPTDPARGPEPWYVQIFYPLFRPRTVVGGELPRERPFAPLAPFAAGAGAAVQVTAGSSAT